MSPSTSEPLLLGIDGGGTSTEAWLATPGQKVIGRGQAGPSNAKAVGLDAARGALAHGAPILCDAEMVARGVTRARLPAQNEVLCTLNDPRGARNLAADPAGRGLRIHRS